METNIDRYYEILEDMADSCLNSDLSTHEFLEQLINADASTMTELISIRKPFVTSAEFEQARGYLTIGLFRNYEPIERSTCFTICFELDNMVTVRGLKQRYERYSESQRVFIRHPELLKYVFNNDLLEFKGLSQIGDSEVLQLENTFLRIDAALNPTVLSWVRSSFGDRRLFVRVNPLEVFDELPGRRIFESILIPANPNWWRNLTIHNRAKSGSSYNLDDCLPSENLQQFMDIHVKGIRRLEVIAKRNNNGNLSMMIEEISKINSAGLMIGRCIHLDTDSEFGSDFAESVLNHLDLAINVYDGDAAQSRFDENLAHGAVVTDASFRSHLLRVEEIPFRGLFGFITGFFKSQILISEWMEDQFGAL